jgi:hypothetical protein
MSNFYICSTGYHLNLSLVSMDLASHNVLVIQSSDTNKAIIEVYNEFIRIYNIEVIYFNRFTSNRFNLINLIASFIAFKIIKLYVKNSALSSAKFNFFTLNFFERFFINFLIKNGVCEVNLIEDGVGAYLDENYAFKFDNKITSSTYDKYKSIIKFLLHLYIDFSIFSSFKVLDPRLLSDLTINLFNERIQKLEVKSFNIEQIRFITDLRFDIDYDLLLVHDKSFPIELCQQIIMRYKDRNVFIKMHPSEQKRVSVNKDKIKRYDINTLPIETILVLANSIPENLLVLGNFSTALTSHYFFIPESTIITISLATTSKYSVEKKLFLNYQLKFHRYYTSRFFIVDDYDNLFNLLDKEIKYG